MKKLLTLLLTAALLTGCAAAGTTVPSTTPPDTTAPPQTQEVFIGPSGTDVEGIALTIESIDSAIHAKWENNTGYEVTYSEYYDIQIQKGDTWISCRTEDYAVPDIAHILDSGNYTRKDYETAFYNISREGRYRLTTQCSTQDPDIPESIQVWAEFTVGQPGSEPVDPDDKLLQNVENIDFSAQYIRTDGYNEGTKYPIVTVIRSASELNAYYEQYKELYDLERKDKVYSDTTIGFLDACDKYDESYFEKQALILILLEEGSGSVRHDVHKAGFSGSEFVVAIDSFMPGGVGTCDVAEWHIFVEPEAGLSIPDDITVFYNGKNVTKKLTEVSYSYGNANMALQLPEGWEYSVSEYNEECYSFGIEFWPKGYSDNKVMLHYWPSGGFGVCGTGLTEETVTLANYTARAGIYDNGPCWSFVVFPDLAGQYVIDMFGAGAWWNEHGAKAMQILGSIVLADGIITESQAIEIAKQKNNVTYSDIRSSYDHESGIWTVTFYDDQASGAAVIRVDADGNILDIS